MLISLSSNLDSTSPGLAGRMSQQNTLTHPDQDQLPHELVTLSCRTI